MRACGILMHITSLPSRFGIGSIGKEAREFVDFLRRSGQAYWQVLPLGQTTLGDSPYQSFSSFAGNPNLIDLDYFINMGMISDEVLSVYDFGEDSTSVDYDKVYRAKITVLKSIYKSYKGNFKKQIDDFSDKNSYWIDDYVLFMALKEKFAGVEWSKWDMPIRNREAKSIDEYKKLLSEEIEFWKFIQFIFFDQWHCLKEYANNSKISIIGDLPIYVAYDSSDVWAHRETFLLKDNGQPLEVAGCPPDSSFEKGQLWGNPLYDWNYLEKNSYSWWKQRMDSNCELYDFIRLDHFTGFDQYYAIPFGNDDAVIGKWESGPGEKLFYALLENKNLKIIVEDLGFIRQEALDLRDKFNFPGMNILQFAFDGDINSKFIPHNNVVNSIIYTGTHDNDTIASWLESGRSDWAKEFSTNYLRLNYEEGLNWGMIRGAYMSPSKLAIIPIQDFLNESSEARMNTPNTVGLNWKYRVRKESLTENLASRIRYMAMINGRLNY